MRYKVHRHLRSAALRSVIPKRYHDQVQWSEFKNGDIVLLLFKHDREDVILSTIARRALHGIESMTEPLRIAIGGNFTQEASRMLHESGFKTYSLSDWFWTDESYKAITDAL